MMDRTFIPDIDMASDDAWEPVWSPYQGKIVPSWMVTQEARFRMGYDANGKVHREAWGERDEN